MTTSTTLRSITTPLQIKGSLFTLTVMQLFDSHLETIITHLKDKIEQSPNFFNFAPIIIDVEHLPPDAKKFDFAGLIKAMNKLKLIPVGVRGSAPKFDEAIHKAGLAVVAKDKEEELKNITSAAPPPIDHNHTSKNKIVTSPVRSGQQIYAKGGDLIVLAPVSNGSELLADGNIHVYAPLRGSALAGIQGDTTARIFCKSLDATIISIAGRYLVNADLKHEPEHGMVHIYLDNDRLQIGNI